MTTLDALLAPAAPETAPPSRIREKRPKTYPGTIECRGDSHRVILSVGGKPQRFNLPGSTWREAVEFARRKHQELAPQRARARAGLATGHRLSEVLTSFETDHMATLKPKTQQVYGLGLDAFRAFFVTLRGDPSVERVTKGLVKEFLVWRRTWRREKKAPLSNRSLQKDRTILHTLFAWAEELDWREGNPVASTTAPKVTARDYVLLSADQYAGLLRACTTDPMLALFALTLGETGMRCDSEALWLRWEDVDLEAGTIAVVSGRDGHDTKTDQGRRVPMTPALRAALREHFAQFRFATYGGRPTPWVFHHTIGRCHYAAGARIERMDRGLKAAARRAGIPKAWRPHDLRHRRITSWLAEGKSVAHVMKAVGHASLQTTMKYTHLVDDHLAALVEPPAQNLPIQLPKLG